MTPFDFAAAEKISGNSSVFRSRASACVRFAVKVVRRGGEKDMILPSSFANKASACAAAWVLQRGLVVNASGDLALAGDWSDAKAREQWCTVYAGDSTSRTRMRLVTMIIDFCKRYNHERADSNDVHAAAVDAINKTPGIPSPAREELRARVARAAECAPDPARCPPGNHPDVAAMHTLDIDYATAMNGAKVALVLPQKKQCVEAKVKLWTTRDMGRCEKEASITVVLSKKRVLVVSVVHRKYRSGAAPATMTLRITECTDASLKMQMNVSRAGHWSVYTHLLGTSTTSSNGQLSYNVLAIGNTKEVYIANKSKTSSSVASGAASGVAPPAPFNITLAEPSERVEEVAEVRFTYGAGEYDPAFFTRGEWDAGLTPQQVEEVRADGVTIRHGLSEPEKRTLRNAVEARAGRKGREPPCPPPRRTLGPTCFSVLQATVEDLVPNHCMKLINSGGGDTCTITIVTDIIVDMFITTEKHDVVASNLKYAVPGGRSTLVRPVPCCTRLMESHVAAALEHLLTERGGGGRIGVRKWVELWVTRVIEKNNNLFKITRKAGVGVVTMMKVYPFCDSLIFLYL